MIRGAVLACEVCAKILEQGKKALTESSVPVPLVLRNIPPSGPEVLVLSTLSLCRQMGTFASE